MFLARDRAHAPPRLRQFRFLSYERRDAPQDISDHGRSWGLAGFMPLSMLAIRSRATSARPSIQAFQLAPPKTDNRIAARILSENGIIEKLQPRREMVFEPARSPR